MLFGEFLNTHASKAGIKADNAELVKFLSIKEIATAEIPDTLVSSFNSLMTLDGAKNNPEVMKSIKAELYNGVDSEMNKAYAELGLDDATKQELLLEKNTNARITKSLKKIADLERAKAAAPKGEKAALEAEIATLNDTLKTIKTEHSNALKKMTEDNANNLLSYDLKNQLAGFNYAFPKEMPKNLQVETALLTINSNLQAKDAKFLRDETGALKLVRLSTGAEYFDTTTNTKVDAKAFIESTLAQNKLLAVTNPDPNPNPNPTPVPNPNPAPRNNKSFDEKVQQSLNDLKIGSTDAVPA